MRFLHKVARTSFYLCYNIHIMKIILNWLIGAGAVLLAAYVVPGIVVSSFYIALIVAFIWGVISFTVKPILNILTLPINILTLGIFSLVLNGLLFWFIASFVQGFEVGGFIPAFLGAFVVAITSSILKAILIRD